MRRGPKNKPTTLLHLHGTWNSTRHGQRPPDAKPPGDLEELPADLSPAEAERWHAALAAAPAGVLGKSDESLLRLWCFHEATFLEARRMQQMLDVGNKLPLLVKGKMGDMIQSPYLRIMQRSSLIMLRMIEQLGFSPVSRTGLGNTEEAASGDDGRWMRLEEMRRKAANG
jgi:P27 family predicted phage terminase small subunit